MYSRTINLIDAEKVTMLPCIKCPLILVKNISSEYDRLRVANSVDYSQRVKKKSEAGRAAWEVAYDEIEGQCIISSILPSRSY
ncbi:hypothetical protein RIR_jg35467.t1 [Rhizophagus irregularis DAOM 181602=DAOM 197198]|nr:hypothetical protein RIR_jg35467.t1 [Rhizophagus irregularis DAOM 181602=DAOM 197198]